MVGLHGTRERIRAIRLEPVTMSQLDRPPIGRGGMPKQQADFVPSRRLVKSRCPLADPRNQSDSPGRRARGVLLEQAMDGLRPVSRAMDGATEPASKHATRATLSPKPTPQPWITRRPI